MTDLELLDAIAKRFGWTRIDGPGWTKDIPNDLNGELITHRILTKTGRAGMVQLLCTDGSWWTMHRVEHSNTASLIHFLICDEK